MFLSAVVNLFEDVNVGDIPPMHHWLCMIDWNVVFNFPIQQLVLLGRECENLSTRGNVMVGEMCLVTSKPTSVNSSLKRIASSVLITETKNSTEHK